MVTRGGARRCPRDAGVRQRPHLDALVPDTVGCPVRAVMLTEGKVWHPNELAAVHW